MGMRRVPYEIHRQVLRRDTGEFAGSRPTWYAVWLGLPGAEGSERIGRTQRMAARWWRVCPETGEWPREIRGWVNALDWLMEVREGHQKTTDTATAVETEEVAAG